MQAVILVFLSISKMQARPAFIRFSLDLLRMGALVLLNESFARFGRVCYLC